MESAVRTQDDETSLAFGSDCFVGMAWRAWMLLAGWVDRQTGWKAVETASVYRSTHCGLEMVRLTAQCQCCVDAGRPLSSVGSEDRARDRYLGDLGTNDACKRHRPEDTRYSTMDAMSYDYRIEAHRPIW